MAHDTKKGQAAIRHALETGGSGLRSRSRTEGGTTNHVASRTTGGVRGRSRTEGGTPSTLKRRKRT